MRTTGTMLLLVLLFSASHQTFAQNSKYDVVVVGTMQRVSPKAAELGSTGQKTAKISLARAEHEAMQLVVRATSGNLTNVRVTSSDLKQENGAIIAASDINCYVVEFLADNPKRNVPDELKGVLLESRALTKWPDPMTKAESFNVTEGENQPLWIDVKTSTVTKGGEYHGTLRIAPDNAAPTEVPLTVRVWDFILPSTNHLPNLFYLWEQGISRAHGVGQRDKAFLELRARYVQVYLDHRISPAAPSYYPTAIRQTLQADGSLAIDWSAFDSDFQSAFAKGQTAFLFPGTWNIGMEPRSKDYFDGPFVRDVASDSLIWPEFLKNWEDRSPTDHERIAKEYGKIAGHLEKNGWLKQSVAYLVGEPHKGRKDNNPAIDDFEFANAILKWVHTIEPKIPTMVTMNGDPFSPEIAKDVDIWAIDSTVIGTQEKREQQERSRGRKIWTYFPGLYRTDALAGAYRIAPWFCWRYRIDGLGPFTDSTAWFAYDDFPNTCILYSDKNGPKTSIRMELLRDGMEDYEYLCLLKDLAEKHAKIGAKAPLLAKAQKLLHDETVIRGKDPLKSGNWEYSGDAILAIRQQIGDLCEQMSRGEGN